MFYLVKSPKIFRWYYHECLWKINASEKKLYLTFDDGPTPDVTDFVLEQLQIFNARATFFNVGQQVEKYLSLHHRIIEGGHSVGNHTYNHLNGWKTDNETYLSNVAKAQEFIHSPYFRPPYGRITKFQLYNLITGNSFRLKPIMWHVLSGDFDPEITPDQCYLNVVNHAEKGSIVVFHDSVKSFGVLRETLPKVLRYYTDRNFTFESIDDFYKNGLE